MVENQPVSGSYFTMKRRLALAVLADTPVVFMQGRTRP
jgi:hypothetical protein